MNCPNCGNPVNPTAAFCGTCGTRLMVPTTVRDRCRLRNRCLHRIPIQSTLCHSEPPTSLSPD